MTVHPETILVVEDEPRALALTLEGLELYTSRTGRSGARILVADSVAKARRFLEGSPLPFLSIIDLGLPDGWGHEVISLLRERAPEAAVIVSTVFDDDGNLLLALQLGASGYVLKGGSPETLFDAICALDRGHPPLSPAIARRVLSHFAQQVSVEPLPITARELEVVRLLARGFTNAEVARALEISAHTVSTHVKSVYKKLQVSSRAELSGVLERSGFARFTEN